MILIRNLLIDRGDYAVVKYLTEDLELGNSTHVAAALANRYVLLCTCLCIGCVTHFILDLNNRLYYHLHTGNVTHVVADLINRFVIPSACICLFIENVTHVVADLINRFVIPSACICLFIENVTHVCGRSYQQVCNTICMYMLVY